MSAASSRWHPLKPIISWLMVLIMLKISFASTEPDIEGEALIDLLTALNDSNGRIEWNNHFVSPCFSWAHVTCRNGNVISLSLASNGFSGTLSPSIVKLKYLSSLVLKGNDISGDIPDSLSNITGLTELDLSFNDLAGKIPMQLFTVPTFKYVS
ncbi:hypothetical protein ACLB2K_007471 [Fragaria x ananassa]